MPSPAGAAWPGPNVPARASCGSSRTAPGRNRTKNSTPATAPRALFRVGLGATVCYFCNSVLPHGSRGQLRNAETGRQGVTGMNTLKSLADIPLPQVFDLTGAPDFDAKFFELGETGIVEKGTHIIQYGTSVDHLFYLHEGEVLGFRVTDTDMSLSYVCKKGFFGEGLYFSNRISNDECIAGTQCRITKFNKKSINLLLEDINVVHNILFTISTKSLSVNSKAENFNKKSVKQRLKQFFNAQKLRSGNKDDSITISLSQKDIAALLNVHPVSVSRALSELKKEMDILTFKNKIILP